MDKKIGLFLQGGGAKGSFQAGALSAMVEKEIKYQVISGTSIGAINGMILLYHKEKKLRELWEKMINGKYGKDMSAPVFETKEAILRLAEHVGTTRNPEIEHFYVNYLPVEKGRIWHEICDLCLQSDEKVYEYVSASSRLPNPGIWQSENKYSKDREELFMEQIVKGLYDGYLLDGGLVNNKFMEPLLQHDLDIIYAIVFEKEFAIPEYMAQKYRPEQIKVIKPDFVFGEMDTMNFTMESLEQWYQAGYKKAMEIL